MHGQLTRNDPDCIGLGVVNNGQRHAALGAYVPLPLARGSDEPDAGTRKPAERVAPDLQAGAHWGGESVG